MPLEWAGHDRPSAIALMSLPATQGQRYTARLQRVITVVNMEPRQLWNDFFVSR
jgi:hypothetical protein